MGFTEHWNLPEMPTGPVDWPAIINDIVGKLEVGRTLKLVAGENLAVRDPFYIKADGKAWKATDATDIVGLWQSTSTATDAEGYGQIGGVVTYGSWTWTIGQFIYVTSGSALSQTPTATIVGYAISATEILLPPVLIKRDITRVVSITSSATPTPNCDTTDLYKITALGEGATFGAPTGTPLDGQKLQIRIKDDGTGRSLAFNAIYRVIGVTLPTTTTASKTIYLGMEYNSADSKWDVLAVAEEV